MSAPATDCNCRNHLGKPKTRHNSRRQAISAIVRRHMRHGGAFTIYRCPTQPGVFHVASERKKRR